MRLHSILELKLFIAYPLGGISVSLTQVVVDDLVRNKKALENVTNLRLKIG